MKTLVRISILALISFLRSAALADGWFWQSPLPQGNSLSAVVALNANTLVAVGSVGTIIRSTDAGQTWAVLPRQTTEDLSGVAFANLGTGLAVGTSGTILRSSDGGQSWTISTSGTRSDLHSVCFSGRTGTAVGDSGTILRTIDAGDTWVPQTSGTSFQLRAVHCFDESTLTVVGEHGTILHTIDGGATWRPQLSATDDTLLAVTFQDDGTGWAVGGRVIISTNDGGSTWTSQFASSLVYLSGISSSDANHVLAVGTGGRFGGLDVIFATADGGRTWTFQTPPLLSCPESNGRRGLSSVAMIDAKTAIAVGSSGIILRTVDGGDLWNSQVQCLVEGVSSVWFVDPKTGWAVGPIGIFHTTDGGSSWVRQLSEGPRTTSGGRTAFFVDASVGWVLRGPEGILHTTDGGANWVLRPVPTTLPLNGLSFVDLNTGWAVGGSVFDGSVIIHTTNGGETWQTQVSRTNSALYGVSFADANRGIAVGDHSTIVRTTDGGGNWVAQSMGSTCVECDPSHFVDNCCFLRAVSFADPMTAIAVGSVVYSATEGLRAVILRTTDSGETWARQFTGPSGVDRFNDVSFADASNGLVVGRGGSIFRTTDSGVTWTRQESGMRRDLLSVSFVDATTATVTAEGSGTTLLRTTTGGEGRPADGSGPPAGGGSDGGSGPPAGGGPDGGSGPPSADAGSDPATGGLPGTDPTSAVAPRPKSGCSSTDFGPMLAGVALVASWLMRSRRRLRNFQS